MLGLDFVVLALVFVELCAANAAVVVSTTTVALTTRQPKTLASSDLSGRGGMAHSGGKASGIAGHRQQAGLAIGLPESAQATAFLHEAAVRSLGLTDSAQCPPPTEWRISRCL